MARPRKSLPSYRLHKASGQAVVTLDGRDVYLGRHDTPASHEAYHRVVLAWKTTGQVPGRTGSALPITVAAMVAAFWRHLERDGLYKKNGKPTTERACIRLALKPLVRLFGSKPAHLFTPDDLKQVRFGFISPPAVEGEDARPTIVRRSLNKHVHRIRLVFQWAGEVELVPATVWAKLKTVDSLRRGQSSARECAPVRPADLRAVVAVLREVPANIAALIRLQWLTGARPGEVVQMRMGDVDRSGKVWVYKPGSHKTEHHDIEREIMLGPRAQLVLAPFVSADPAAYLFPGAQPGTHLPEESYQKVVRDVRRRIGAARWTPNMLRHNAGTRFRRHGGIEGSRVMLGHTDAATTMIYAEADRQKSIAMAAEHG